MSPRVRFGQDLLKPRLLADGDVITIATQEQVPERTQHAALGLEGEIDGLQRDAGRRRDRRHRRPGVAVSLEELLGDGKDLATGRCRLLAAERRVVRARALDLVGHSGSLGTNSLLAWCTERSMRCRLSSWSTR